METTPTAALAAATLNCMVIGSFLLTCLFPPAKVVQDAPFLDPALGVLRVDFTCATVAHARFRLSASVWKN